MISLNQVAIPSISTMKEFEKFLKCNLEYCIIIDFHISLIEIMIKQLHDLNKKAIIHIDLIKGLSSDEAGCEYLCQKMKCDGIISIKSKVIECANKHHLLAIQRMFLIDSKSLEKGISQLLNSKADFVEVLPGIAYSILPYISQQVNLPIISGGLIKDLATINCCLEAGACGVSVGNLELAIAYNEINNQTFK